MNSRTNQANRIAIKEQLAALIYSNYKQGNLHDVSSPASLAMRDILALSCKTFEIPLADITVPELDDMNLLHIFIKLRNINGVRSMVGLDLPSSEKNSYNSIPRNSIHASTNNALHFCALYARNDEDYNRKHNPITQPLNADMIEIIKIISDFNANDRLPLDVEKSVKHADGGTHVHAAFIAGALDVALYFLCFNAKAFTYPRYDGKTPIDFAGELSRNHMDSVKKLKPYIETIFPSPNKGLSNLFSCSVKTNTDKSVKQTIVNNNNNTFIDTAADSKSDDISQNKNTFVNNLSTNNNNSLNDNSDRSNINNPNCRMHK